MSTKTDGQKAAYGERQPLAAQARKWSYKAARGLTLKSRAQGSYLEFHPAPRDAAELADLSARVNWYLADRTVPVYVDGSQRAFGPADAPHMDPALVKDPGWSKTRPAGKAIHVFWHLRPAGLPAFFKNARRAEIADPFLFSFSDSGFARLRERFAEHQVSSTEETARGLFTTGARAPSAFVLATGPSAQLVDPATITDDVRITCNSAVRDRDLITAMKPNVIAFADPVFHYGPSKYAAAFRDDLLKTLDETDAVIVTIDQWASILLANMPEVRGRIVVLSSHPGSPWHVPSATDRSVRHTGNILTNVMLPTALALADHIKIAGCDGRQPQENYFWQHNQKTQYSDDLMRTAFDAHPAFFRDRDYADYYDEHCRELEDLLATGERLGRSVEPVTPSWIPALVGRGAPSFGETSAKPS